MLSRLAQTHDLVPKQFLRSFDWLVHLELGYVAYILTPPPPPSKNSSGPFRLHWSRIRPF